MQRGMMRRVVVVLLGAALGAGSLPLEAHADRDGKRRHERRREREAARHHERSRDHGWHHDVARGRERSRDRDDDDDRDRDRRYSHRRDRDEYAPRRGHHHRVVYVPRRPVRSGVSWALYASNLPPVDCDYWDPYCGRSYGSLQAYRYHLRRASHPHVIHVLDDDGVAVCGYRDRGGDSWVRVTLAAGIRF